MHYQYLKELIEIDSPSGFTDKAAAYVFELLKSWGWEPRYTNKGAVVCALGEAPKSCIAAHLDTLGAIISGIDQHGRLEIHTLGGLSLNMAEGEYCRIYTLDDQIYTGTLLLKNPSVHVNKDVKSATRSIDNVHIRLDEKVSERKDVEELGIQIGDIVCVEPRYRELENGFIKSRFLDNKAGCMVLFELAKTYADQGKTAPVELFFSNYEEVGHGAAAGYSSSVEEMLVIDMGVVGENVEGSELACSICAKDSTGPYDYAFRKKLVTLAKQENIPFKLDVYPFYGSDGSAARAAGHDFKVGLIGPGVAASHGVERTHKEGIKATFDLCIAYLKQL